MITIHQVPTYKMKPESCALTTQPIDNIVQLLKSDKQYHERLNDSMDLTFNIDIEYLDDFEIFKTNLINYLNLNKIIISTNDISYTQNSGKIDKEGNPTSSYHLTIPKLYCSSTLMKNIWDDFKMIYNYGHEIDNGHLGTKAKWFRLPNQSKESKKGTEHKILQGKIEDFVLQYLHPDSFNLNETFKYLLTKKTQLPKQVSTNKIVKQLKTDYVSTFSLEKLDSYKSNTNKTIIELLKLLNPSRFDNYDDWKQIGMIIRSVYPKNEKVCGCCIWDELSKQSSKYEPDACTKFYKFKKELYTIGSLHYYSKLDNPEKYHSLINNDILEPKPEVFDFETNVINKRYLVDKDDKEVMNMFDRFYEDKNQKVFSAISSCSTGKTSFMREFLHKYNPDKVLYLSFRKSLTYDIERSLEDLAFDTYLNDHFDYDKLIIQIESLMKLESNPELFLSMERVKIPKYDFLIIDEIVSVLNQFSSPTFKGKSKEIFEYLEKLIKRANKVVALDADYCNRSHNFLKNIVGDKIAVIENKFVTNDRTLCFTKNRDKFNKTINEHLQSDKKIVIVAMASSEAEYYNSIITTKYPSKKVQIYIGDTDDKIKTEHFKNVTQFWENADVVIFSSTIEAGVDFNKEHFDKIFCILQSDVSCSQRSLLQMLYRVRQIRDKQILIVNDLHLPMNNNNFWTYDEVLNGLKSTRSNILHYEYVEDKEGEIVRELKISNYDQVMIYNKVEQLNKNKTYFLTNLIHLAKSKHYGIEFDDETVEEQVFDEKKSNAKIDVILNASDIDKDTYSNLLEKQKRGKTTTNEKLSIQKYHYKQKLGINQLNKSIMEVFYRNENVIDNFIHLMDEDNLFEHSDIHSENTKTKLKIIKELIKQLGFKNLFDTTKQDYNTFMTNYNNTITNNYLFKDFKNSRALFGLSKIDAFDFAKQTSHTFKYLNAILNNYCIKLERINPIGKRQIAQNCTYQISLLYNIQEIIEYKSKTDKLMKLTNFVILPDDQKLYKDLLKIKK